MCGGFSQYKVFRQTPSNILRLSLWNFTDQWRGSNPKANPPFFYSFHSLWLLLLSEPLFISISLSLSFFLLFMFLNHSLFLVFSLLLSPKLSYCFLWFSHPLYLCPCQLRPCFISSIPSASLSLPLSHSFSLGLREGDQNVCWRNRASSLFTPHYYCSI